MMYIHYCSFCKRLHMLNGHKTTCPGCRNALSELKLSYMTFVEMDNYERQCLLDKLNTEAGLKEMSTTYRMLKYSRRFKEKNLKVL